ncbi:hypothetical protein E5288_WYG012932 [Bos mutus]|uniref:Uncharacterized protein n=1 Tax=Bos mutus TaxID=72004 RepID=A0A6B0R958_9CETA|nr:hypothetical protein [Bos mutus]
MLSGRYLEPRSVVSAKALLNLKDRIKISQDANLPMNWIPRTLVGKILKIEVASDAIPAGSPQSLSNQDFVISGLTRNCKAIDPQNMHNHTPTHSFTQDMFIKHLLVAKYTGANQSIPSLVITSKLRSALGFEDGQNEIERRQVAYEATGLTSRANECKFSLACDALTIAKIMITILRILFQVQKMSSKSLDDKEFIHKEQDKHLPGDKEQKEACACKLFPTRKQALKNQEANLKKSWNQIHRVSEQHQGDGDTETREGKAGFPKNTALGRD